MSARRRGAGWKAVPVGRGWPWLVLLLTAVALHLREICGGRPYDRDSSLFYVPVKHYLAQVMAAGELPQWWPFDSLGTPLLAQPMFSVFHPTTLLYRLLPFWTAFTLQDVAGTALALSGTYLLARRLGQRPAAATLAATLFGANGYLVSLGEHTFMKLSAGTMPWYAWALLVAARRGGPWLVAPAMAMGLLLLAGDPQQALLASAVGLALVVGRHGRSGRPLALALGSPVAGALVAAVQLLPAALLAPLTERAGPLTMAAKWPLTLADVASMAFPSWRGPDAWADLTVVGLAGLALAWAGLVRWRRRGTVLALAVVGLLSTWLSLGDAWGLNVLARWVVPFWGQFRYPMKAITAGYLALALLAGEGFGRLAARSTRRQALALALGGALVATVLFAAVLGDPPTVGTLLESAVALVAALGLSAQRGLHRAAVVTCTAASLAFTVSATVLGPPDLYEPSPLVRALQAEGAGLFGPAVERWDSRGRPADTWLLDGIRMGGADWSSTGGYYGLPSVTIYMPGASWRLRAVMPRAERATNLGLSRVFGAALFVVARTDPLARENPVVALDEALDVAVVRQRQALPRAYVAHRARTVPDAAAAAAALRAPEFRPGREILVEDTVPNAAWAARPDETAREARVVGRSNAMVTVEADLPWPGFVVLNEAMYPGWTATLDEAPVPVLVANAAVRAVEAPAGRHRVVFRYRTPGLAAGLGLSATALAALGVAAVWLRLSRRPFRATRGASSPT